MNTDLPTGTVTFLFTDIEGSTLLLQALGSRWDVVLSAHHAILRDAFTRHQGKEVGTEGDSFFVAFSSARAGVDAAVAAQRALGSYDFAGGVKVRVRMGLHTGEGHLVDGNYRGIDVHRAARIASAGHGGQILASETTRALVDGSPGEPLGFSDLGDHRLKDLDQPERLYQVTAPGLESSFPPPRSIDSRPNNLTEPVTSFIGRERELQDIRKHLRDNRLVTLTGPGGTGKSRLALQVAYDLLPDHPDGVFVVPLASVADPGLVASAVAQTLGMRQQGKNSIESTVKQHLAGRNLLLVLDNFEHVLPAAFFVSEMLAATSLLKILVTSRAPLRITAEQEVPIPPLSLPPQDGSGDLNALESSEAVRLFVQRARAVRPDFMLTKENAAQIVEICLRLDGLPLALELAAARIRTLEPHELARRLDNSLALLTGGPRDLPARQRTLRNAIAWSYDLLDGPLQELFCKLGVFAGGFSLQAAEQVGSSDALDLLEVLAEQSMVKTTLDQFGARFQMLGPVREFALERLKERGQAEETLRKHAEFFLSLTEQAGAHLQGPTQVEWLGRLEVENDNLRAVMAWALGLGKDEVAARLGWNLWLFWWLHGHQEEGRRSMETLLQRSPEEQHRALALAVAGSMALVQGDHPGANRYFREGIDLARKIDDKTRLAFCLQSLGLSSLNSSDWELAVSCFEEALPLFGEQGNLMMVSGTRTNLGTVAFMQGDLERAERQTTEALTLARKLGDPVSMYFALYTLGQVALARGDLAAAAPLLKEGLFVVGEVGNPTRLTYYLQAYGLVLGAGGDLERSARLLGASEALRAAAAVPHYIYLEPPGNLRENTVSSLSSRMGSESFEKALAEGRAMSPQQAVAYALGGAWEDTVLAGGPFGPIEVEPPQLENEAPKARQASTVARGPADESLKLRPAAAPVPEHRMVGRKSELARLEAGLHLAEAGRGGAILVFGEPGIGKTRLVEELVLKAPAHGFNVVSGSGVEGGSTPGHWPWVQVVSALLVNSHPAWLGEALGAGAAQLARIVPGIEEVAGPIESPPAADAETGRVQLFQAVTGLLTSMAVRRPLLVVLEDLQWADVASLELLSFLAPLLKSARILLVGTYRPGEVGPDHPLTSTMAVLSRHQVVERIELKGLAEPEVAGLIAGFTGEEPAPSLTATVRSRTEGNPFFVTELARLLASDAHLGIEGVEGTIPAGVRDVVRRRLGRLPADTNAILSTAAVMGRQFDLQVVGAAFRLDPDRALGLVEAAVSAGLVEERRDEVGRFRFKHDIVRETILEEMSAARRAMLHSNVAEAIESISGDASEPIELAFHFAEAASVLGPGRAIPHMIRAAEAAVNRLAYEQARDQLHRALDLVAQLPSGRDKNRQELDVLMRLNILAIKTKGYAAPELAEGLERARSLADQLGENRLLIPVRWGLVSFHNNDGNTIQARRLAEELLQDVQMSDGEPAELVPAHLGVGIISMFQGELPFARRHFEEVLALGDGLSDPWLLSWMHQDPVVSCSTFHAWCLSLLGESELSRRFAREAIERATGLGNDFDTAHALYFASAVPVFERQAGEAREAAAKARDFAHERAFHGYVALSSIFHGWAVAQEADAAAGVAEITSTLSAMAGMARIDHSIFLALLAEAHLRAGDPTLALAVADQGLEVMPRTGERFYEAELHRIRGELLLEGRPGQREDGRRALETAVEVARQQGARLLEARAAGSLERRRP